MVRPVPEQISRLPVICSGPFFCGAISTGPPRVARDWDSRVSASPVAAGGRIYFLSEDGVTTVVEGPDGSSPVPLAPFLKQLEALRKSINIGSFIGQGSVRDAVMGRANRRASAEEIDKMRVLVERGMRDGSFGLSSGLDYAPGAYAPLEEIVELAKVAGPVVAANFEAKLRA